MRTKAAQKTRCGTDTRLGRLIAPLAALALALAAGIAPAQAQGQFHPAITVDGIAITTYALNQRQAFLTLLHAPGDIRATAADQLINEAIEMREAAKAEVTASDEEVKAGMDEFAARGSLTTDQLLQLFQANGVAAETFRDFVAAGVTWRSYVQTKLVPKITISEHDIDAAMATMVPDPGQRVLMLEIVLPTGDPATARASKARAARLRNLTEDEFGEAALRFSVGKSRNNRGKMRWLDPATLPPGAAAAVRGLKPGHTSRPVQTAEGLRLYYMVDREKVKGGKPVTDVDYAALLLAGGQSKANLGEAARIRARVTSCDDLYPIARALPPEQLVRETVPEAAAPAAYRAEIARLDPGEISTRLTSASGAMVVLMVCSRGNALPRSVTRAAVKDQLANKRAATMAQFFLDEQRGNARIVYAN